MLTGDLPQLGRNLPLVAQHFVAGRGLATSRRPRLNKQTIRHQDDLLEHRELQRRESHPLKVDFAGRRLRSHQSQTTRRRLASLKCGRVPARLQAINHDATTGLDRIGWAARNANTFNIGLRQLVAADLRFLELERIECRLFDGCEADASCSHKSFPLRSVQFPLGHRP